MLDEYMLTMTDVSKSFPGVKALDKAKLNVRRGSVHALMGENGAGKSTLMKCLFGIYMRDSGDITFNGKSVEFKNPRAALDAGIAMVHQELSQVLERNIMDNIWLGSFPKKGIIIDEKEMYRRTKEIFSDLQIDIDPAQKIGNLSISQRQMVEIAKAVSMGAKVIVLDEPTSSLTESEVAHLFIIIRKLKEKGCSIIYISHKMDEIFQIADEITIMRDGKWVATEHSENLNYDKIISLMVGRDLVHRFPEKDNVPNEKIIMSVKNLKGLYEPAVSDVSFELHEGEILGIAGLVGSRRTETIETIFGLRKCADGEICVNGKQVKNTTPAQAIKNGFSLVTEERRVTGIFADLDIRFNSSIANLKNYVNKLGVVNHRHIAKDTDWVIGSMNVKTPSHKSHIGDLSGGNQQKVIIGRWLLTNASILMLDEPTRGIDVIAKFEIYQMIINLAKTGKGIIFVSSEMPELLGVTDRIMVISNGRVAGIVQTKDTTQEEIMRLAAKYL